MMFNFWFDLSKSLIELLGEEATREEINFAKYIEISSNKINTIFEKFQNTLKSLDNAAVVLDDLSNLKEMKEKLLIIQKEKSELVCKTIKFETKLISKILDSIEKSTIRTPNILMKIKMFLKVVRLMVAKAKEEVSKTSADQQNFFMMIQSFGEKVQSKLFQISQDILKDGKLQKDTDAIVSVPKAIVQSN